MKKNIRSVLVIFSVLLCHASMAQQQVRGHVTGTEGNMAGAVVSVLHTQWGTATDSAGNFVINDLPSGKYKISVRFVGYNEKLVDVTVKKNGSVVDLGDIILKDGSKQIKEVTVKGKMRKGSAMDAIGMTKKSDKIITVLAAESIGKLPDKNVAEAVQRVAGVKMERNKGEGSTVALRGTPTDWTATLINGDRLPTADEEDPSRTFEFMVFPSSLVDYITVTRTVTPDIEADNIGGAINFRTVTPPDKQKLLINLGSGTTTLAGGKPLYDFNFTYGNITKNKKLAYVLSGSYYERAYGADAMRLVYGSNYNHAVNRMELKDYFGQRTTIGVNAQVDYHPSEKVTVAAHFMHGRMDDDKWQYKTTFNWADGSGQRIRDIGTHGALQRRLYGGDIALNWKVSTASALDVTVASYYNSFEYGPFPYGKGDPRNGYMNYQFINNDLLQYKDLVNTDFYGNIPADPKAPVYPYKLIGADNPYGTGDNYKNIQPQPNYVPAFSQYRLETVWSELNHTHERDPLVAQLNYTWKPNSKWTIKAGGKFRTKEGSREISKYEWILNTQGIDSLKLPLDRYQTQAAPRSSSFLNAMSSAYQDKLLPFLTQDQMGSLVAGLGDSLTGRAMDKYNPEYSFWVGSKYKYTETVAAGYVMAETNIGSRLKLVGGVRFENTHFHESADTLTSESAIYTAPDGTQTFYYEPATQTVDRSYLAVLPSLNAHYSLNERSALRAAVSRTFHRPNFEETKPGFAIINYEDLEFTFGNPDLKPTYSYNFDLSYEYYWGNKGVMVLGVYYKDVKDHIFTTVSADKDPVQGILYKKYENAGRSYIAGIEASFDKQFHFLHGFWSGFGLNANITYSYARMQVPGRDKKQAMTEQTPLLYNIALYYEKGRVNTRLALNYSGAYLKELNLAAVDGIGILHKDTDYDLFAGELYNLDFQAAVKITKHFSTYVEINNLLNAPFKTYVGQEWRVKRIEYYGQRMQLGLKFEL
jgi:TonB-dependent receptor